LAKYKNHRLIKQAAKFSASLPGPDSVAPGCFPDSLWRKAVKLLSLATQAVDSSAIAVVGAAPFRTGFSAIP
jgi:hypothetical protein